MTEDIHSDPLGRSSVKFVVWYVWTKFQHCLWNVVCSLIIVCVTVQCCIYQINFNTSDSGTSSQLWVQLQYTKFLKLNCCKIISKTLNFTTKLWEQDAAMLKLLYANCSGMPWCSACVTRFENWRHPNRGTRNNNCFVKGVCISKSWLEIEKWELVCASCISKPQ